MLLCSIYLYNNSQRQVEKKRVSNKDGRKENLLFSLFFPPDRFQWMDIAGYLTRNSAPLLNRDRRIVDDITTRREKVERRKVSETMEEYEIKFSENLFEECEYENISWGGGKKKWARISRCKIASREWKQTEE